MESLGHLDDRSAGRASRKAASDGERDAGWARRLHPKGALKRHISAFGVIIDVDGPLAAPVFAMGRFVRWRGGRSTTPLYCRKSGG
eukprot:scaffold600_cov279-Pinguiococcus_pyrenoidosus.AAC.2